MNHASPTDRFSTPAYRLNEQETTYQAEIILPGVARENLEVRLEKDVLHLTGKRTAYPETWRPLHREIPSANFRLGLRLGREVDSSRITAELRDGILKLALPKVIPAIPVTRAIEVN